MQTGKTQSKKLNVSKILFYISSAVLFFVISFGLGLISASNKNWIYRSIEQVKSDVELVIEERSNLSKTLPKDFLQPARYSGSGVTIHKTHSNDLILLSGFFKNENELRLIRRDGKPVARWVVKFSKIFPDPSHLSQPPATDWNVDTHGALMLADGSVVFNFEYAGLVKLDRCGKVIWKVAKPTHHSLETAEGGGFWVPGRKFYWHGESSPFPPFKPPFKEDTIMRISDDGKIVQEISVPKLFYDNQLEPLLTSTGEPIGPRLVWDQELVHLNKIAELKSYMAKDFPNFKAGDLLLSLRNYNMIFIVDPKTQKIKWWKIGPWKRQHDPEFIPGGSIIVFNNNIYRSAFTQSDATPNDLSRLDIPRQSNIIQFNPITGNYNILYGGKKEQQLLSVIRGKHEWTAKNGLFITEFEGGRVIETDRSGNIIWEYVNRYDKDQVAEITEARIYPAGFFTVQDWSCVKPPVHNVQREPDAGLPPAG